MHDIEKQSYGKSFKVARCWLALQIPLASSQKHLKTGICAQKAMWIPKIVPFPFHFLSKESISTTSCEITRVS
jgi:hypothetical protein